MPIEIDIEILGSGYSYALHSWNNLVSLVATTDEFR